MKPRDRARVKRLESLQPLNTGGGGPVTLAGQAFGPSGSTLLQRIAFGPVGFVDPSNSTGFASDSNTGATATNVPLGSGPILTVAHLNSLMFYRFLTSSPTILFMSDDPGSVGLDYSTLDFNGFNLTFQGTPITLHTGGTLNAGTTTINPAAPSGGQRQLIHTSDLATFAPYDFLTGTAAHPARLVDTTGANNGTASWVVGGVATASVTRPISTANFTLGSLSGPAGALTIGDAYKIQRGSVLTLALATGFINSGGFLGGSVTFNDFAFSANSYGNTLSAPIFQRCSFEQSLFVSGAYLDCYTSAGALALGFSPVSTLVVQAGLFVTTGTDNWSGLLVLANDVYITGLGLALDLQTGYSNALLGQPTIISAGGIQLHDNTFLATGPQGALSFLLTSNFGNPLGLLGEEAPALIWGNGNAGLGVAVGPGATGGVSAAVGFIPTVTGTLGDFGFIGENGGAAVTIARAWDNTIDGYTTTRTTTWAHFAATIGAGGFGFQAHNPATGASLVGV